QEEWERNLVSQKATWTIMEPIRLQSTNGATLTKQSDGSILASGANPDKDTYRLEFQTNLAGITALRLEVLPDASLPQKGPGRANNGNFVLSELSVTAAPRGTATKTETRIGLQNASADFFQSASSINRFPVEAA